MTILKNSTKYLIILILTVFCLFTSAANSFLYASAESTLAYDNTDVLDDLEGMTIEGEQFNLSDYAPNSYTQTDVIVLAEYGYSCYEDNLSDYGLYIYVWNPQLISYELRSVQNQIEMSTSEGGSYYKYELLFLDVSEAAGYEGVFYKYKVILTADEKEYISSTFKGKTERYYHVSGLELLQTGAINATEYNVNKEYIYSGYAAGYGADPEAASTLTFRQDVGRTLELDVNLAAYRPDGNNGVSENTQDSIHTAYFAVPNSLIEEYGELTAVHATWLNAVIAPTLVIKQSALNSLTSANMSLKDQLDNYLGVNIGRYVEDSEFAFAFGSYVPNSFNPAVIESAYTFYYNLDTTSGATFQIYGGEIFGAGVYLGKDISDLISYTNSFKSAGYCKTAMTDSIYLNTLNMYIPVSTTDLDGYEIPVGTTKNQMLELSNTIYSDSDKVLGTYAVNLFSSIDDDYTDLTISSDDTYKLTEKTLADFWDRLTSRKDYDTEYKNLNAIYAVQPSDLIGDKEGICENLCIGENYYEDFVEFYEANKSDSTIYLMRYQLSDYEALEAHIYDRNSKDRTKWYEVNGFNAYIFQETVNLGFDIIDVTFNKEGCSTVIAIISDPQDFIPEPTSPLIHGEGDFDWLTVAILLACSVGGIIITRIIKRYAH